ncbi:MAG: NrdH-redoxin [Methanosarcinales archaeon]|nr:NrdH-redoxin [Methanosarcinales archaeon]
MSQITIYSTKVCPNCQILKKILSDSGIAYNEMDMSTPAALTELTMNSVFTMSAPVLQIQNRFYTTKELFNGDTIDRQKVEDIIAGM